MQACLFERGTITPSRTKYIYWLFIDLDKWINRNYIKETLKKFNITNVKSLKMRQSFSCINRYKIT